jgi:threonine-phosphate decarboxylase
VEDVFRYPDPECRKLGRKLSTHLGIAREQILIGAGVTELIYLAMRALKPRHVLIPVPTFSEYERAVQLAGGRPLFLILKEDQTFLLNPDDVDSKLQAAEMIALCNPNNPTGTVLPVAVLEEMIQRADAMGKALVVDESFVDFTPRHSLVSRIQDAGRLLILRSFTKFFSLAGLRLGYAVGSPELVNRLRPYREPWSVSSLAQIAGQQILDHPWRTDWIRQQIRKEREFLTSALGRIPGLKPFPSQTNFILIKVEASLTSTYVTQELAKTGVLIRDCSNFRGLSDEFVRVAVKRREDNKRLIARLAKILEAAR